MKQTELLYLDKQYVMPGLSRYPFALQSAEGLRLTNNNGQSCLDFSSGMGAYSLGQGEAAWTEALLEQLLQYTHTAPTLYQEPSIRLAEQLCIRSGMSNACFLSSGREALRLMCALARARSTARYGEGRTRILHVSGEEAETEDYRIIPPEMDALYAQRTQGVCAVLIEPCPLRDGCTPLSSQFVHALTIFCAEQDWLLLVDERLTGAGRTGSLFAFQDYGIMPDLLCFSETIAGGLPLGGVLAGSRCRETMALLDTQDFALGANPLSAVGALSVLERLNEDVLAQAKEKGEYLRSGLECLELPQVERIAGSGLLLSLYPAQGYSVETLLLRLLALGLLCMPTKQTLLVLPPLTVQREDLDAALAILERFGQETAETSDTQEKE